MILCVRGYVLTSELTQVKMLSLPPSGSQRKPKSGGVFAIQSGITIEAQDLFSQGLQPSVLRLQSQHLNVEAPQCFPTHLCAQKITPTYIHSHGWEQVYTIISLLTSSLVLIH